MNQGKKNCVAARKFNIIENVRMAAAGKLVVKW
jgi:hypothetical protein